MKNILVTGGAGFIGSNFINYILSGRKDVFIVNLDKLTYAGNLKNLTEVENHTNYTFIKGDIVNDELVNYIFKKYQITHVINFAAESHVDRSILGSEIFFKTNVIGTNVLLENAKLFEIEKFIQISTDEVYGSLGPEGKFEETRALQPNSPYAASKASADLMALASHHTYGVPVVITRCSNNYGQYQFPEKLIPLMIINSLNNKKLPVYGDGLNVRDWIYVIDHNEAIEVILDRGKIGEVYNIGANEEKRNIEIVKLVLSQLGKSEDLIEFVKDRPGHDKRYAINSNKIRNELGWEARHSFNNAMKVTIDWYLRNEKWWTEIISGDYKNYYKLQYSTKNIDA
jgi:dTDP-glucose 4,6-dehydratase